MKRKLMLTVGMAALTMVPTAFAQSNTGSTTLGVTIAAEATFTIGSATTSLTHSGTTFASFTGTTNFTYQIRTTQTGGSGSITLTVADFQANGPALTDLTYTCTAASGSACSSAVTASTSSTNVVTFGTDIHSADTGDAGSVSWTLVDKPAVKTGNYTSTATFTISAS